MSDHGSRHLHSCSKVGSRDWRVVTIDHGQPWISATRDLHPQRVRLMTCVATVGRRYEMQREYDVHVTDCEQELWGFQGELFGVSKESSACLL